MSKVQCQALKNGFRNHNQTVMRDQPKGLKYGLSYNHNQTVVRDQPTGVVWGLAFNHNQTLVRA